MWWLAIVIPLVLLFSAWLAVCIYTFKTTFYKNDNPTVAGRDMSGTHYDRYKDIFADGVGFFTALEKRELSIRAKDGKKLVGYYCDQGSDKTVVLVHGYHAALYDNFVVSGRSFWARGYNLLFMVQRAHGKSDGKLSTFGEKECGDLLLWLDEAERLGAKKIIAYGVSMGGAMVALASPKITSEKVKALVVDCAFDNAYEQVKFVFGKHTKIPAWLILPAVSAFVKLLGIHLKRTDVAAALKESKKPVFFLHGTADTAVPFAMGRHNYESCGADKRFFVVEGEGHTTCFVGDRARAEKELYPFLASHDFE